MSQNTTELVRLLLIIGASIPIGILAGMSSVYVFNRLPAKWLCPYGGEPSEEILRKDVQRLKSYPWKWVLSAFFVLATIKTAIIGIPYALAVISASWLLNAIAVADQKYKVVPDPLVIALAAVSVGFLPFHHTVWNMIWGILLGGGLMLVTAIGGKLLFKRHIFWGEVKLCAVIGMMLGWKNTAWVMMIAAFLAGTFFVIGRRKNKIKKGQERPLGPYIAAATILYLVLLFP